MAIELRKGRTYRGKKPRAITQLGDALVNDRTIIYLGIDFVQYDGPAVKTGRHYPRVKREEFLAWAERDVTDELPKGEYAAWPPKKPEVANG